MHFAALSAFALLAPVLGLPTNTTLSARNSPYGIYVCSKTDWEGECYHVHMPNRKCYNFKALSGKVNSFGPDKGLNCFAYGNTDCAGLDIELLYPGMKNFEQMGWSDKIKSAVCIPL
ncbi:hypothetical protein K490DRAFT_42035 [Saccharata proteae CBS 121410]|uniref:Uncharacterized protein n=1 Tax=Saccharata proteae CBS 121410 TaxID=1314787 RepID=A0A9P4LYU8_9PEZI|nr:hypothetical protein K490DRAFT_42035 [Saccharata proteae CBS 121410]